MLYRSMGEPVRGIAMSRLLLIVACLCGAAFAGERPMVCVGSTDGLIPIAPVKCQPLYEVKAMKATLCRNKSGEKQCLVLTATVQQNNADGYDLLVGVKLSHSLRVVDLEDAVRIPRTKRGEAVQVRFVMPLLTRLDDAALKNIPLWQALSPIFSFKLAPHEPE